MEYELVVPLKNFDSSMQRLSGCLDVEERSALMQHCARNVIQAGHNTREIKKITIVSDEEESEKFAESVGANFYVSTLNLNDSLNAYRKENCVDAIYAHADLCFIDNFSRVVSELNVSQAVIAPDRHRLGSNIIGLRRGITFDFKYGHNSFNQHRLHLDRNNLNYSIIKNAKFFDLDDESDLKIYKKMGPRDLDPISSTSF